MEQSSIGFFAEARLSLVQCPGCTVQAIRWIAMRVQQYFCGWVEDDAGLFCIDHQAHRIALAGIFSM